MNLWSETLFQLLSNNCVVHTHYRHTVSPDVLTVHNVHYVARSSTQNFLMVVEILTGFCCYDLQHALALTVL